jgi:hypothetical protein
MHKGAYLGMFKLVKDHSMTEAAPAERLVIPFDGPTD